MKKILCAAAVALAFVFATPSAHAAEENQPTWQEMRAEFDAKITPLQDQLHAKRMELSSLHRTPSPDQAEIQRLVREIADLQASLYNSRLELEAKYPREDDAYGMHGYGMHGGRMGRHAGGSRGNRCGWRNGGGYSGGHHGGHGW